MGYLADLLTRFARTEALYAVRDLPGRRLDTVADSLLAIQRGWQWESPDFNPEAEQTLRRHLGDYALFMTGVFRERVERLAPTAYYVRQGQRAYRFVSEHDRASARPTTAGGGPLFAPARRALRELRLGARSYARRVHSRARAPASHRSSGLGFH